MMITIFTKTTILTNCFYYNKSPDSSAEVEEVKGYIGNFVVKVRKKARYVNTELCNSCGACYEACPSQPYPLDRKLILGDKVFKEGKSAEKRLAKPQVSKYDLTLFTGAQPMPEQAITPKVGVEIR